MTQLELYTLLLQHGKAFQALLGVTAIRIMPIEEAKPISDRIDKLETEILTEFAHLTAENERLRSQRDTAANNYDDMVIVWGKAEAENTELRSQLASKP